MVAVEHLYDGNILQLTQNQLDRLAANPNPPRFRIHTADDNIDAFYTNPQFVMAFGPLFESVSQPVFVSTDWHQW